MYGIHRRRGGVGSTRGCGSFINVNIRERLGSVYLRLRGKNKIVGMEMSPEEARMFFKSTNKTALTLFGYSSKYEDWQAALKILREVLSQHSPATTLVNIGATRGGLGMAYPVAKSMGFTTTGIVASLALKYPADISDAADYVCFIKDDQWGGMMTGSNALSPTSQAMVSCADILVGIGGGEVSRDEMIAGRDLGKPIQFYPAEVNHEWAVRYARKRNMPEPKSFWGAAHDVFGMKT